MGGASKAGFLEDTPLGCQLEMPPSCLACPPFASSCLIAMALKNSKTGSLPVSEIYSFMKEHFPYFKVRNPARGRGARAALTSA